MSIILTSPLILGKKTPEPTGQEKQSEAYELAYKRLGGNTYAPPTQVQPGLPKTSVGLALKVYPIVGGFLTSIGQSFVNLGLEELDIIQYNVANPAKAVGPKLPSYPITEKEKQIQQEKTDVAIVGISTAAMFAIPVLIPAKIAGSAAFGLTGPTLLGARTLATSGIGAASGYYFGGVQGAEVGALTAGIMYLGSLGALRGLRSVYNYIHPKPLGNYGIVDIPDIGYTAPRTMSEKVLGLPELESPYQLRGLQPLEAESTAWEMSLAPRTSAIDPLAELVEPPTLTRPVPSMPYIPHPELTARLPSNTFDFLPKLATASVFLGLQALGSQRSERSIPTVSPLTRGLPKLDLGLDLEPDLASALELSPLTIQSPLAAQMSVTEQVQIQRQIPRTVQSFSPEFRQLQTPRFDKQNPFNQDFNKLFTFEKRKKSSWSHRYMWEFPVKGPKETWKVL